MAPIHASFAHWIMAFFLIASALGVILLRKPIAASLSFLLSLLILAAFYLQLSAEFIAVMQILVYAGAILVIFVFVIVLFQDAHEQLARFHPKSNPCLIFFAAAAFIAVFVSLAAGLTSLPSITEATPAGYGDVHEIGRSLYLYFFFPFEAVILLFLAAIIGSLYIAKKEG